MFRGLANVYAQLDVRRKNDRQITRNRNRKPDAVDWLLFSMAWIDKSVKLVSRSVSCEPLILNGPDVTLIAFVAQSVRHIISGKRVP